MKFNGAGYDAARDDVRLTGQILRVWALMNDKNWRTLGQISDATGDPQASVSAQLRHLRKPRFGGHLVERQHINAGLFKYRLIPSEHGLKTDD